MNRRERTESESETETVAVERGVLLYVEYTFILLQ